MFQPGFKPFNELGDVLFPNSGYALSEYKSIKSLE